MFEEPLCLNKVKQVAIVLILPMGSQSSNFVFCMCKIVMQYIKQKGGKTCFMLEPHLKKPISKKPQKKYFCRSACSNSCFCHSQVDVFDDELGKLIVLPILVTKHT